MNKVIIDGVDVAGCEFFSDMSNGKPDTICKCYKDMYGFNTNCEHNKDAKNCYYKQLQRAKAEIEELKKQVRNNETAYHTELSTYNMECGNLLEENKNLIEENELLKFKLNTVEADYEASEIEIEDLKNKLNLLTTANNHLLELDKYRQKELETKAEATKSNIHNLALLSKANKTLQELEKENEQLKADIESRTMCITCKRELHNCNLQAENERLKSIVESNNQQVEQAELLVMDNDRLQQEVENLKDTIYYDVEKYSQALQEIREIIAERIEWTGIPNNAEIDILAKINEVIGAEE